MRAMPDDDFILPVIWYAVLTKPQKEGLVSNLLAHQGFETLYLHYWTKVKHARRTRLVQRAYFPRYIFAAVDIGLTVYDINHTIGVSTVIYLGDNPLEIPTSVIEELQARGDSKGMVQFTPREVTEHRKRYRRGEMVRIDEGPLVGFIACVELDRGHQVKVWVSMFKSEVEASFEPEALSPARRRFALAR